jgi:hypothetical protein
VDALKIDEYERGIGDEVGVADDRGIDNDGN